MKKSSKNEYHFYLASGFFNPGQLKVLNKIKRLGKKLNLKFFSPMDDNIIAPDSTEKERLTGVQKNLTSINKAKFIIVNTQDKDMGTIFEAGYAHAYEVPIIYYCEGLTGEFNLMLANTGIAVATDIIELEKHIVSFLKDRNYYCKYEGKIE